MTDEKPENTVPENTEPENTVPENTVPENSEQEIPVEAEPVQTEAPVAEAETESSEAAADSSLPELTIGEGAPADAEVDPDYEPTIRGKIDRFGVAMGTGRRKTAVARVRVKSGDGKLTINGRELGEYFSTERDQNMILAPLKATDHYQKVDIWVRVNGGGSTGQAGAVVLGIARALQAMNADLHHTLSDGGFLTRDGRMVERKKYGYKKARKSFQFSKR